VKITYLIISILTGICFLTSCESNFIHFEDEGTYITDTTSPIDLVSFQTEIVPILQTNCASCHFAGTNPDLESPGMYDVIISHSYINLGDPENSGLLILPDPGHADDYLTGTEHTLIITWIEQGALNN
jgi:hypothetical protein